MGDSSSLNSSLLGAALGYGIGGTGRSAILGAVSGYALNKISKKKSIFGGRKSKSKKRRSIKRKKSPKRKSKKSHK